MGRTRIELLSSGDIDMYDDVSTPLTFAVADIRTPDKRDSHFSKTIKVPATKGNNIRFGHIFDINLRNGTYNPNRKAPCTLYIDDVPQLEGFLQILNIEVDDKSDMFYNCTIKGNVNNIFQTLGDDELTDLDLSSFDHLLTRVNQKASWANTYTGGYCYPLIDYGFDNNINHYKVEHLMPAVFLRTLIDKIFSNAGFTYSSTFFDSTIFKNLIIPCTGEGFRYSNAQIEARSFEASISALQNITYINPTTVATAWQQLSFNTDVTDPANAFDTGTSKWTVPTTGYYNVICDATLNTSGTIQYGAQPSTQQVYPRLGIRMLRGGVTSIIQSSYITVNTTVQTYNVTASNVFLNSGDVLDVCIADGYQSFTGSMNLQLSTTASKFYNKISNTGLQAGDTVVMTNTLPTKIKQKDLLLDVIRMFNLYVETDKNDSNKLLIETRDNFYSSGTIVDWTYKLDNSKPLELTPMGDLDFKILKYSYKDDKDFYNKKYLDDYTIGYGNRVYEIENDFLTSTKETKVMFSPTPLAAPSGDDRVIPKIWEVDSSNVVKNKPFGVRLLYKGATLTTNFPYQYEDTTVSTTTETQYLYAGHLDSVTAPTIDLSFAVPREVYYSANIYTNANLFNLYHKRFIDEITDPDSKVVTGYFYLTPYDIAKLDFRNTFYFENQYFRLNKIYDYNPIDESVTKCEFLKIKEGRSFSGGTSIILGGFSTGFLSDNDLTDSKPVIADTVNTGKPRSTIVYGDGNVIGGGLRNSYINGGNNYIHGGNNINLLGSSGNTIYDGLENVTLINTSGTTIDQSNVLYINGYAITSETIASLGGAWFTPTHSSSNYYPDAGGWGVDSSDVITNRYTVIGKTLYWQVYLTNTTTATSPTQLYLTMPNGYLANSVTFHNAAVSVGATIYNDIVLSSNNTSYVYIYRSSGSAFNNGACTLSFNIVLEIQ